MNSLKALTMKTMLSETVEFKGGFLVFDDMLDFRNETIEPFFTRGWPKDLDT